jgi:ribose transport system ATP-binding protein
LNTPLLELKNVCLQTSNFLLNSISIDLFPGEVHAIMGENGSGKSLLMQLISGFRFPDKGEITFNGKVLRTKHDYQTLSKETIYIRQDLTLLENLSIAENLFFHNLPYKNKALQYVDYDKLQYQFHQLITELNLPFTLDDKVGNLGLAQRQIIEFCKAYISNATIVILDEPSGALNTSERDLLYKIVSHILNRGAGIFFITHRIDDVFSICDRITLLKRGELMGTKVVSESTQDEIIKLLSNNYIKDRYPKFLCKKGKTILHVNNLCFEGKLNNINFSLREGEILGITGLAGSGRSLLANCLFGVTKYQGEIYINNAKVTLTRPKDAINHGIALIPEDRIDDSIFHSLNTNENVAFPSLKRFSKNLIINSGYLQQTVLEYIMKINLTTSNIDDISTFSGGNLQKAIFAKWIMNRAKIFIIDEPTRGIDIPSKIDIYNFINDLVKKKVAIIYISSDIEEIFGICDRVAVLSEKTLVCDFNIADTSVEEIVKLATLENDN